MEILYIVIGIILIIVIYSLVSYNGLVGMNNSVKEAFATMDVYLKKRWDLVPNIVETVKGYAKHEKETLESIIKLRNSGYSNMSLDDKLNTNEKLTNGISKLMMLAESYPELKSNQNFINLSDQLTAVENDIANARKYYNAVVKNFNNKVEMFPSSIIAKAFGFKSNKMFEVAASERENIKVVF